MSTLLFLSLLLLLLLLFEANQALLFGSHKTARRQILATLFSRQSRQQQEEERLLLKRYATRAEGDGNQEMTVAQAIQARFACKAFARFDRLDKENDDTTRSASPADPTVVQKAWQCLDLARLSPSSFNTQPYRVVLVHSAAQKMALSAACLGPNARRVRDADCTAVFLADKQVLKTILKSPWRRENKKMTRSNTTNGKNKNGPPRGRQSFLYISLFSSGYPLPRILSAVLGFLIRTGVAVADWFTRLLFHYPLPTLSSAETWATKQTSLLAMSYMLACTSVGLATIPMEGIHAGLIRRALGIPRRYAIPLIVATGRPAIKEKNDKISDEKSENATASLLEAKRYRAHDVLFGDRWMEQLSLEGT